MHSLTICKGRTRRLLQHVKFCSCCLRVCSPRKPPVAESNLKMLVNVSKCYLVDVCRVNSRPSEFGIFRESLHLQNVYL